MVENAFDNDFVDRLDDFAKILEDVENLFIPNQNSQSFLHW